MPYRKVNLMAGYYYHIFNRGVDRQQIFFRPENWGYFIELIRRYFQSVAADIIAYCLMPNHYHLLALLKTNQFSSEVMQPFSLAYTKAINRHENRVGPLFQGPFKAILVDRDEYLLHLSRYIHCNPVNAGLVNRAEDWAYSSYRDYIGMRNGTLPKPEIVLSQFDSRTAYRRFIEAYTEDGIAIIEHLMLD